MNTRFPLPPLLPALRPCQCAAIIGFKVALDELNIVVLEGRALRLFNVCDLGGEGKVGITELEVALMINDIIPTTSYITPADSFYTFDLDGGGDISWVEFKVRVALFGRAGGEERGGVLVCCCLGHLTVDHASLSRWSTVPTPNRDTSNIWALLLFSIYSIKISCLSYSSAGGERVRENVERSNSSLFEKPLGTYP